MDHLILLPQGKLRANIRLAWKSCEDKHSSFFTSAKGKKFYKNDPWKVGHARLGFSGAMSFCQLDISSKCHFVNPGKTISYEKQDAKSII